MARTILDLQIFRSLFLKLFNLLLMYIDNHVVIARESTWQEHRPCHAQRYFFTGKVRRPPEMRAGVTTIVRAILFPRRARNWPNRADRAPVVGTGSRLASRGREIEARVGGADVGFGKAQFAAHDIG